MAAKTTQALKISASWTPERGIADRMIEAAIGKTAAKAVAFSGGRLSLKHAIKIDFADPAQATRVSARVADIKAALETTGELHGFTTTAGAVPIEEAEVLPDPEAEAKAEAGAEAAGDGSGEAAPPADDTEKQGKARRKATTAEAAA